MFQTVLPSPERDAAISGRMIRFPYFPNPYLLGLEPQAPMRRERIDLSGRSLVKSELIQAVMHYTSSTWQSDSGATYGSN